MFHSSLRRVARTCPNAALSSARPSSCSIAPTTSPGTITASFTTRSHQRRNSSSKPPIPPNNGSTPIPTASVKQVGAPRSDKRPGTESRLSKRKVAKGDKVEVIKQKEDLSSEWTRSLPSVPSTQHLDPKDVYVASFFSTHRPISITGPLPPETSTEDIEKIFQVKSKSQRRTQDVIYTLSSAVQTLDKHVASQQQTQHDEGVTQRVDIIKALTRHNNNSATNAGDNSIHHLDTQPSTPPALRVPGNVKLVIQALTRQFRPFNPPPAPVAAPEVEFFARESENLAQTQSSTTTAIEAAALEESQARVLEFEVASQDVETAAQSTNTNTFFTPSFQHSSRRSRRGIVLASQLQHIQPTRQIRRIGWLGGRLRNMLLISVKRQRRLKMKKHKYKKLQRKTRNLRRRQGKI